MVPEAYVWRFKDNARLLFFSDRLLEYVVFDTHPEISPALWQDVEMYIRYRKRDTWTIKKEQISNAHYAIIMYRVKYIIEHLTKSEILEIFDQFYENEKSTLSKLFEKKFHAPVDDLFLVQERHIVTKDEIKNFDKIFAYPSWIEFNDEAIDLVFSMILDNQLTNEQMDYFLGASDDIKDYDKWFKITKHILTTTEDSHLFWTAGDVLGIIQRAIPEDEKSQKWFRDQIFEIFWPRVKSIWPMENHSLVNFEHDEHAKILRDSISWLDTLSDLKERLPELDKKYELTDSTTPKDEFARSEKILSDKISSSKTSSDELINRFFELSELTCSESDVERLRQIAKENIIPAVTASNEDSEINENLKLIDRAIKHAEKYVINLKRERKNIAKLIEK